MPVERTLICPPRCRMGAVTPEETAMIRARSPIGGKYDTGVNRESAYEIISRRAQEAEPKQPDQAEPVPREAPRTGKTEQTAERGGGMLGDLLWGTKGREGMVQALAKQAARTVGSQIGRQILRGVLGGILGGSKRR